MWWVLLGAVAGYLAGNVIAGVLAAWQGDPVGVFHRGHRRQIALYRPRREPRWLRQQRLEAARAELLSDLGDEDEMPAWASRLMVAALPRLVASASARQEALLAENRKAIRIDAIWIALGSAVVGGLVAWVIALSVH